MDTKELAEWLQNLILDSDDREHSTVSTFDEAQVLSTNDGLVIKMIDGTEYQLTIVRSK